MKNYMQLLTSPSAGQTIKTMPGLELWLDATDIANLTFDTSYSATAVSQIRDLSPFARHAINPTYGQYFFFTPDLLHGKSGLVTGVGQSPGYIIGDQDDFAFLHDRSPSRVFIIFAVGSNISSTVLSTTYGGLTNGFAMSPKAGNAIAILRRSLLEDGSYDEQMATPDNSVMPGVFCKVMDGYNGYLALDDDENAIDDRELWLNGQQVGYIVNSSGSTHLGDHSYPLRLGGVYDMKFMECIILNDTGKSHTRIQAETAFINNYFWHKFQL